MNIWRELASGQCPSRPRQRDPFDCRSGHAVASSYLLFHHREQEGHEAL